VTEVCSWLYVRWGVRAIYGFRGRKSSGEMEFGFIYNWSVREIAACAGPEDNHETVDASICDTTQYIHTRKVGIYQ
jgi:hypothetical protein